MIGFTPIPTVDRHGNIITSFTLNGITFMLSQDVAAAEAYIEKLREAIEKSKQITT